MSKPTLAEFQFSYKMQIKSWICDLITVWGDDFNIVRATFNQREEKMYANP